LLLKPKENRKSIASRHKKRKPTMLDIIEHERVRANTAAEINWRIDRQIEDNVRHYAQQTKEEISRRVWELEQEWDIERVLETMASSLSLFGIALSVTKHRRWIILSGVVLGFFLMHAIQGWCPPIPVLRRLGVRTREEIDRERYALKLLIGDFPRVSSIDAAIVATTT
jgi:hypothetical protein